MSNKQLECPRCGKRCGNASALKTHMKTHKKPEPKSGSLMKWIVKREPVKSESKKKVNDMVELQPIVKTRQLKLRKAPIREPTGNFFFYCRNFRAVGFLYLFGAFFY